MNSKDIVIALAEKEMAFRLHFTGTEVPFLYFGGKIANGIVDDCVAVEPDRVFEYMRENSCPDYYAEYNCLLTAAGDTLLHDGRMLFHGVAMIYKEKGYILAAPSGTGKSTQFSNLHVLFGDACRIINGDKPVIRRMSECEHRLYPSPWNGKENWAGMETADLKAIIWLEQGKTNFIEKATAAEMVLPVLTQVFYSAPDTRTVHEACQMVDSILKYVPVYRFVNTGDIESSRILARFLDRESEDRGEI